MTLRENDCEAKQDGPCTEQKDCLCPECRALIERLEEAHYEHMIEVLGGYHNRHCDY